MRFAGTLSCFLVASSLGSAADFRLVDGDRVVFVGNTLIEREQRDGYFETALTRRFPRANITFRNLGWSGDNVWGEAQAGFGSPADGFRHLQDHVTALKPTVIIAGYGTNESFAGPAGLAQFESGLHTMLDMLARTRARIVLLAPIRQEKMPRPLPDPGPQNKNLAMYRDVLQRVATQRGYPFVDFYDLLGKEAGPLTDNGIHLTPQGYWRAAHVLEESLGITAPAWRVEIDAEGKPQARGAKVAKDSGGVLRLEVTDDRLPLPSPTPGGLSHRFLSVAGLPGGKFTLRIDDKDVATATAAEWSRGVDLHGGPEFDQAEQLRQIIVAKNREYFHRWRPQNETYLFGFRKHEQGQNAREIPQFDPIIAGLEGQIAKLRLPVTHRYELVPVP